MELEEAAEARELLSYPMDTAGGVMVKEYVSYPLGTSVGDVLDDLRRHREEYGDYDVRYFYVTDRIGVLKGVLRLRDMVLSPRSRPIDEVMITDPDVAPVDMDLTTLQHRLEIHSYSALPVVDAGKRLLGVVIEKEVAEAARKSANRTMLKLAGIFGGEELRSMPTWSRVWGRLSWLFAILALSVLAALVIKLYEGTLQAQIGLAMFLPVVAGMAGSSGNQAMALSLREMAMGVVKPWELTYVLIKETKIGLINGTILGIVLMVVSYLLSSAQPLDERLTISVIVGMSLVINTFLAVCIGGTLPLALKRAGLDPAAASGPILTTVVDTGGFFLVLSLAAIIARLSSS
jgi:magnesium transporter